MNCQKKTVPITLDQLPRGVSALVLQVQGGGHLRKRLLDMGLVPGTRIKLLKAAPLGDPIEITLRGYVLSLRLEDARRVLVGQEEREA